MASTETSLDMSMISKMKVAELKKELKARGLSTVGSKLELSERLAGAQAGQDSSMSDDGNAGSEILDEDEVLEDVEEGGEFDDDELNADAELVDEPPKPKPTAAVKRPAPAIAETQAVQPKKRVLVRPPHTVDKENGAENKDEELEEERILNNGATSEGGGGGTEKKVVKLSAISAKERLELRAQKFGTPLSEDAKKQARAERFGLSSATTNKSSGKISLAGINSSEEVLKKRAERFGCNVSATAIKIEAEEKRKKRMERFGSNPTAPSATATATLDEKKKLRAERFKI